eukprot:scaffold1890_cov380-Prasinococcus_capsulatus_cf.AAC.5
MYPAPMLSAHFTIPTAFIITVSKIVNSNNGMIAFGVALAREVCAYLHDRQGNPWTLQSPHRGQRPCPRFPRTQHGTLHSPREKRSSRPVPATSGKVA